MKIGMNRITIISGGIVLVPIVVWMFVFEPMLAQFATIRDDTATEQSHRDALEGRVVDPGEQERKLADVREKQEKITASFFSNAKALDIFTTFESLAERANIKMDFTLGTTSGDTGDSITINFTTSGDYADILSFTQGLEAMPLLIILDDVAIIKNTADIPFTANIAARVFTATSTE